MSVTWVSAEPHDLFGPQGKNLLASSSFYSPGWLVALSLQSPQDIVQSASHSHCSVPDSPWVQIFSFFIRTPLMLDGVPP